MRTLIKATDPDNFAEVKRMLAEVNKEVLLASDRRLTISLRDVDQQLTDRIRNTGAQVRSEHQYVLDE